MASIFNLIGVFQRLNGGSHSAEDLKAIRDLRGGLLKETLASVMLIHGACMDYLRMFYYPFHDFLLQ